MFWIYTRVKDNIEADRPICILKKMPDSQRIFCIFGQMYEKPGSQSNNVTENYSILSDSRPNSPDAHRNPRLQFKFYKNQEIPEFFYNLETDQYSKSASPKALNEDFVDFNLTLIDNGDDKLCL